MESAPKPAESTLNDDPQAVVVRREPERDLVTWNAPARVFKRRGRKFYVTTFSLAGIAGIILFIAEGLMPVVLIASLVFLYYVLTTVQPDTIEYKITNRGVKIAQKQTGWQYINRFWFSSRGNEEVLILETATISGRLELVINNEIKEKLRKEISAYAPYEEAPPSALDKLTNWVAKKLPDGE